MKIALPIPAESVREFFAAIPAGKRTGQLRLNFSQGNLAGGAEWIEKAPAGESPIRPQLSDLTKRS
jgi:hypothetical protein